jgi:hypothetical protein
MSGYRWDVFLSFRRWQEWPAWIEAHFEPLFRHYLGEELGDEPRVFIDWDWRQRRPGDWPRELGVALSRSRVLVPLLSRLYFRSPWCSAEYDLLHLRERAFGQALIVPAVIHDGRDFPEHAVRTSSVELSRYTNPRLAPRSPKAEALADKIAEWVPLVVQAIRGAPEHDPTWEQAHVDKMDAAFDESRQRNIPPWG